MKELIVVLSLIWIINAAVLPSIPPHLVSCYSGGGRPLRAPRRLDVFVSLLKKMELESKLDARLLSTSLLRSLRLDGIEEASEAVETDFVLPFRASAFQFHKYKILMDLFLPSQDLLSVDEILSLDEKCLLHRILSSTVRRWERGDENIVCPTSAQLRQNVAPQSPGRINSRCPVEEGVIQTKWGPVAAGTLISAVAASLEFQDVLVTDILNQDIFSAGIAEPLMASAKQEWFDDIETLNTNNQTDIPEAVISNVWVATLAGDLAEVVVNQGPRFGTSHLVIGTNNRWNDTLLPREHYLLPQNASLIDWHFTDAEIMAGIDGLILAQYIPKWLEERRTLRVSQIIEMYYSNEGVSFDPRIRACDRQTLFRNMFDSTQLLAETSRLAHVLSLRQITVYIPMDEMDRISAAAVIAFENYLATVLREYHTDCQASNSIPVMDLIVTTDGSWKGYDVEQFMSWMGGALEVNMQRSTLGLLHGNTARWIVPPSDNLTTVFSHLNNFTDEWPNRLNLPSILSTIIGHERNKTLAAVDAGASASPSTVVLIVSPSDRLSNNDIQRARSLMRSLRASFFDVYFVYASQDLNNFQDINNEYMDYSELFLQLHSANIQDVIDSVDTSMVKNEIPTTIMGVHCPFNGTTYQQVEYEDFIIPGRRKSYRIHPHYLRFQSLITVQFRNAGQGQLLVCSYRGVETKHTCQIIAERDVYQFNLTTPCQSPEFCIPAHFTVEAQSSSNTCANDDCRLPNQVLFYIQHSGLACLALRGAATSATMHWLLHAALAISLLILN